MQANDSNARLAAIVASSEDAIISKDLSGKDGSLVSISLTVSPVRTAGGEIIGASKIARDITERRRLRAEADEASRQKDEFLAVLSHKQTLRRAK